MAKMSYFCELVNILAKNGNYWSKFGKLLVMQGFKGNVYIVQGHGGTNEERSGGGDWEGGEEKEGRGRRWGKDGRGRGGGIEEGWESGNK